MSGPDGSRRGSRGSAAGAARRWRPALRDLDAMVGLPVPLGSSGHPGPEPGRGRAGTCTSDDPTLVAAVLTNLFK